MTETKAEGATQGIGLKGLPGVLLATLSTQAVASWAMLALASIAPIVAESFGLPPALIGYQIAIIYGVAMLVSLIAGGFVMRWGACRVSQLALLVAGFGCLIASVPALAALVLASVAIGFAYGLTNPAAAHLLSRYTTTRNRSFVFSIKQTGVPIGGIAAGLLTPWVAVTWGWQAAVALILPLALLLALLLAPARPTWDEDRRPDASFGRGALRGAGEIFSLPSLRWLCICGFFFGVIQLCLMAFVVSAAVTELAFDALLAGALLATVQASGVVGRLSWGFLADRLQRNAVVLVIIGAITATCCLAFSQLVPTTPRWQVFVVSAFFGASAVGWNGVFLSEVVRLAPPAKAGPATGLANFFTFGGILVGPSAFVQLQAWLGSFTTAFAWLIPVALVGALFSLFTLRGTKQRRSETSEAG
jgi:MFS family permease